jgi:hypothetical protein
MAESKIPTPPETPPSMASPSTLRTQLSKQFSDGFFSLARANHTSPTLGSRRRYGEEGYDERMKAQRRIVYSTKDSKRDENWNETEDWKAGTSVRLQSLEPSDSKIDTSPGYRISIQKTEAPLDSQETSSSDETDTNRESPTQSLKTMS